MQTLNFSIFINAPKEKVWHTMLDDATYREWTKPFNETSYYKGDWSKGSKILFLGTDKKGENKGGMVSEIADNIPYQYISIRHRGVINKGVEEIWEEDKYGYENYTLNEKNGGTEVLIKLAGTPDDYAGMMKEMWPKALDVLKNLAEK